MLSWCLLFLALCAEAQAGDVDPSLKLCEDSGLQTLCMTSCAPACATAEFLSKNVAYCVTNGLLGGTSTPKPDDVSCATIFAAAFGTAGKTNVAPLRPDQTQVAGQGRGETSGSTKSANPSDCDTLETLSARRRCELSKSTPNCTQTVTELEGKARLLVTQIEQELHSYGELLRLDWSDVNNRPLLCSFSEDDLNESYKLATENPDSLRALQRQATNVQSCQSDWEAWVRSKRPKNDSVQGDDSDVIDDVLARSTEERLKPLKAQIEGLSTSISKLENAADSIINTMDRHIIYCDPKGTPLEKPKT